MYYSHTAIQMYEACGQKYKYHYIDRYRNNELGSALFFGSAVDDATGVLLLSKKKNLTKKETELKKQNIQEYFHNKLSINNGKDIRLDPNVSYFKSDFDLSLLEEEDKADIYKEGLKLNLEIVNEIEEYVEEIQKLIKSKVKLDKDQRLLYNYIGWKCLYRKGLMMIEEFEKTILPQIHEVYSLQEKVELRDGRDVFIGYIDVIASFVDDPKQKYIIDVKTSSTPYKKNSIIESQQLAIYSEYKDIKQCSFIVIEKKVRKRKPRIRITILKDEINDDILDNVFDKITDIVHNIEEKNFRKNEDSCYMYGKKCPFYNLCKKGDNTGLIKKK